MTLVEFLHPLKGGKQRDLVLATMYFLKRYKGRDPVTAPEVKSAMVATKMVAKTINVNQVINGSAPYVHSPGGKENGALLFALTDTGDQYVRELLGLPSAEPEIEHDVTTLSTLAAKLSDDGVRGYVEEAITCLQFGALRAAVVFLWTGAIRTLHEERHWPRRARSHSMRRSRSRIRRLEKSRASTTSHGSRTERFSTQHRISASSTRRRRTRSSGAWACATAAGTRRSTTLV